MNFQVIVVEDAINLALKSLKDWPGECADVKVCLMRTPDKSIVIVYGPESMIHEDILRNSGISGGHGGGDSIRLYVDGDGVIKATLTHLDSISLGPLRLEFRDAVVEELKKLLPN